MSGMKYRFDAIDQAAVDIHGTVNNINSLLDNLKSYLRPMVSQWEGESAVAYNAAQAKWDRSAADLSAVLQSIATTVQNGNNRMRDINHRAALSWG